MDKNCIMRTVPEKSNQFSENLGRMIGDKRRSKLILKIENKMAGVRGPPKATGTLASRLQGFPGRPGEGR